VILSGSSLAAQRYDFGPFESYGYSSEDSLGEGSYLGVDTRDITPERLSALKMKEEHGVEVTMVDQDAPAGKAGILEHDVILSVNGNAVESVEQLRRMIRETPPGRTIALGLSRDGQPLSVKLQLADRKKAFTNGYSDKDFSFTMPNVSVPDMDLPVSVVIVHSSVRSGIMVENLTPQLGDFFGAKNGRGVLVRSVERGSRAEKAGFRAGDVIVRVDDEKINDSGDFTHALRSQKPGSAMSIGIIRDRKEQTLTLTLPPRDSGAVQQEGSESPEIGAETEVDLGDMRQQIASLRPQMELAMRELQTAKPNLERQIMENAKQYRDMARQIRHSQHEIERDLEKSLHRLPRRQKADI
jgi:membrane-associated protease RseP (regulator of RpoE activity)